MWPVYPTYDIYENAERTNVRRLTTSPGYDAEATWCHQGGKIIFTSMRDGDLDLYEMDEQGNVTRRLTNTPGYDGGAFYSADCKEIVWRANHPTGAALDEYRALLKQDLVKPTLMELFVANADGSNARQITSNGAANFCPYFTPDGKPHHLRLEPRRPEKRREFDLYIVPKTGGEPGAHHIRARLRRLPGLQSRRPVAGVGVEPREPDGVHHEPVSGEVGGVMSFVPRRGRAGRMRGLRMTGGSRLHKRGNRRLKLGMTPKA